ncbi:Hsp20/alpha crystallin family protein [Noviherbaspirillum suwonense]|uniref:Molecular chaperone IbpA, HSP20 family n=1 Tax=Noviherbaspirillum suwonense TaxID=1224511 RepID=A0ABY1Q7R5_9BURK|nr:Hsp20/alpha crystallin family protein [Noviherbaspirillum suwonense]SMP61339.1 Molecular chaperone IbpA, HSP20 family [Noviherbaspirillum suwonense]
MNERTSVAKQDRQVSAEGQDRRDVAMTPPVDVIEDAYAITLLADMPGVSKDKLNVQFETDTLTIEGEVSLDLPEGMESSHAEVRLPLYRRVFSLSRELDTENSSAEFRNGVLKLRIPKAAHVQPRKIEVRTA